MSEKVIIFDTTLRDGEQALAASLSVGEKIVIAKQLERLGVDVIEAGFPVSSKGDFESVSTIAKQIKRPVICGLARCIKKDIEICADAVRMAAHPRIHIFIGTSRIHREKKLRKTDEEILQMAKNSVRFARRFCDDVEFSPEDAGRTEREFLYRIVELAIKHGATTINLPDTVGYTYPEEFGKTVQDVVNNVPNINKAVISVHCHNDLGLAVANSITAIRYGARQVECAMNGLGERAGNAALEEIVMILATRKDVFKNLTFNIITEQIWTTSKLVSQICNVPIQPNKAIVGANAFAHSSGVHQDGVLKERATYEIMSPQSIGLKGSLIRLTSRSGSHMVKTKLLELGYSEKDFDIEKLYEKFKALADKKGTVYDDDLVALVEFRGDIKPMYELLYLNAVSGKNTIPTSTIRLSISGGKKPRVVQEAATGDGPVSATIHCIERITGLKIQLEDYKLSAMPGGAEAVGQVDIVCVYKTVRYHGRGSSTDIVEASALAYLDVVNKISRLVK
jgi:2-isopropylmalate synthase